MKKHKIKAILLVLVFGAFLASGCENPGKIKELEKQVSGLNQSILQKDAKIKALTEQAQVKQKEMDSIKKDLDSSKKELDIVKAELDSTKKELDKVNKNLSTLTAVPETVKK